MTELARVAASEVQRPYPPCVRSFDIFDTLIARRCLEPVEIFRLVERRSGFLHFAKLRQEAEARVCAFQYNIDTIYEEFVAANGVTIEQADALKQLEIECELENAIPINQNISQVRDGDILVSDMYLSSETIHHFLRKAGFERTVEIIVSSDGKKSGRIWPELTAKFSIEEHFGDNSLSDVSMPTSFGIVSRRADQSTPTLIEATLIRIGLRDLGLLCREARLLSWHANPEIRVLQEIQASLNLPLLILASIKLGRLMQAQRLDRALFSSRDCNLWHLLFPLLAARLGLDCEAEYFYTSRLARTNPSDDYLSYAEQRLSANSVVVDICGTGWSMAHLIRRLDRVGQQGFFFHELPPSDLYEQKARTPSTCRNHHVIGPRDPYFDNRYLEMCNYSEEGMVMDVAHVEGQFAPVFAPDLRPVEVKLAIDAQRHCLADTIDLLKFHPLHAILMLDDLSIKKVASSLYTVLSQQISLLKTYSNAHMIEDREVMISLLQQK